jgi:hypothetical protein
LNDQLAPGQLQLFAYGTRGDAEGFGRFGGIGFEKPAEHDARPPPWGHDGQGPFDVDADGGGVVGSDGSRLDPFVKGGRREQAPPSQEPEGDPEEITGRIGARAHPAPVGEGASKGFLGHVFCLTALGAGELEGPYQAGVLAAKQLREVISRRNG